jgi:hypothetical protein
MWGLISAGLFVNSANGASSSLFYGDFHQVRSPVDIVCPRQLILVFCRQFGVQIFGLFIISLWSIGLSFMFFSVIDRFIGLRVSLDDETEGLDAAIGIRKNCELQRLQVYQHVFVGADAEESLCLTTGRPLRDARFGESFGKQKRSDVAAVS